MFKVVCCINIFLYKGIDINVYCNDAKLKSAFNINIPVKITVFLLGIIDHGYIPYIYMYITDEERNLLFSLYTSNFWFYVSEL